MGDRKMNLDRCRRWARGNQTAPGVLVFDVNIDGEKAVLEWRDIRCRFVGFAHSRHGWSFSVKFLNAHFPQMECVNLRIEQ